MARHAARPRVATGGGDRGPPRRTGATRLGCRLSRSLGDGLFELRFTLGPSARRITYRFTKDSRIILLTTFRKQRNNERHEIDRARIAAAAQCALRYP